MNLAKEIYFTKEANQLEPGQNFAPPLWSQYEQPSKYVIDDDGLVAAVNAAIILGQPLLLTGEPGTGKTSLADRVAWQLNLGAPLKFETKSNSVARDLFYTYDAVGRFQAARVDEQWSEDRNLNFITFQALGRAILQTGGGDVKVTRRFMEVENSLRANGGEAIVRDGDPPAFDRKRSVVLIDEIDKAHRDFPNDLLNEIDRMFFTIPELANTTVRAAMDLRPIVLITSNSERNLPDPFLRRCVFYHIEFPDRKTLIEILRGKVEKWSNEREGRADSASQSSDESPPAASSTSPANGNAVMTGDGATNRSADPAPALIKSCVDFFRRIRGDDSSVRGRNAEGLAFRKKPATSELIGWTRLLLTYGAKLNQPLAQVVDLVKLTLSALAKTDDDLNLLLEKHRGIILSSVGEKT